MKKYRAIPLLLAFALLYACGLNNTMYNARKYFRAAQERPLNTNGRPSPQAVDEYTKAIKKCGIIIANRKDSRLMDDALFLMAKALYLKGNSAFQAKDQFQALITGFPDSPFVPEAHIYLAKVLREINLPTEATKLLEDFVRDPKYRKDHPRSLLTLAEFRIADRDYLGAQFWLGKIINEYPKTPEYTEAFFLYGKNYYVQEDYATSLTEFEKFVDARGIDKLKKMEARYYMALSHFELGNYDRAMKLVQGLLNDESRPEKLGPIRVLKARLLFAGGKNDEAVAEVDAISKAYPRTSASAEAFYHLGDYHFYTRNNIGDASTAYNKVRTEFQTSELVASSQQKVAALNQLKANQNLTPKANLQQFVDYYMQAAESYNNLLALPDSARVMYDRLIDAPGLIRAEMDSLIALQSAKQARLDSLDAIIDTMSVQASPPADEGKDESTTDAVAAVGDSLSDSMTAEITAEKAKADTVPMSIAQELTETPEPDPQKEPDLLPEEIAEPDTLAKEAETAAAPKPDPGAEIRAEADQLRNDLANLDTQVKNLGDVLARFDNEYLPFAYFAKASLLYKQKADPTQVEQIYTLMQETYPASMYTNALQALKNGEPVRLVDPEEERQEALLDKAFGMYPDQADSMRVILEELVNSRYGSVGLKASFRLGWLYSYEARDTTLAKPYLDKVLKDGQGSDQATLVSRFYDGKNYKVFTSLQDPVVAEADSLISVSDSLMADPDSLMADDKPAEDEPGGEKDIQIDPASGDEPDVMDTESSKVPDEKPAETPSEQPILPESIPDTVPEGDSTGGSELE